MSLLARRNSCFDPYDDCLTLENGSMRKSTNRGRKWKRNSTKQQKDNRIYRSFQLRECPRLNHSWDFFMPSPNVEWQETYCFCPVRLCVHSKTLLTWYLAECLTHFHQTYVSNALWGRDERFTVWGQKVKGQGHGGIKYAGNNTFRAC